MKKLMVGIIALGATALFTGQSYALNYITTSANGNFFGDNYGYEFSISETSVAYTYAAQLKNTSPASSAALIDLLAFSMNPEISLGTDFSITDVSPNWTFSQTNEADKFEYRGDANAPGDRLEPGEMLTFNFNFLTSTAQNAYPDLLDYWRTSSISTGAGIGGGDEEGQVAVSFQQLGTDGEESDLLVSNLTPVPEPATMMLFGTGIAGLAGFARKRAKKN